MGEVGPAGLPGLQVTLLLGCIDAIDAVNGDFGSL